MVNLKQVVRRVSLKVTDGLPRTTLHARPDGSARGTHGRRVKGPMRI